MANVGKIVSIVGVVLDVKFDRARQSAVTQEITEIVGGVEALK